ncbi:hypothetical protein Droror1_Dr00015639 [Drosera rotundifolia]
MWRRPRPFLAAALGFRRRRLFTAARRGITDEGDWYYSSEWWGNDSDIESHCVFRGVSEKGNGVVSVLAYPSSTPSPTSWKSTEEQLQEKLCSPNYRAGENFNILGYQWRVLRFNDDTRQSTVKVMAASLSSKPGSVFLMQQGHCLAVPYTKSMASVGLASLACCGFDLSSAARSENPMRVLCIGHGGGSLPLFLATTIEGAVIDIVEIDPLVISASVEAMGFPPFSVTYPSGKHIISGNTVQDVLWRGIHERLYLHESDAEQFVLENKKFFDIVFIDAYDGNDIFPHKLWNPDFPFLEALARRLHPGHGTVVVNLHSDVDIRDSDGSVSSFVQSTLPMGKYISKVCSAYRDAVLGRRSCTRKRSPGLGFVVSVPSLYNTTLVACRGFPMNRGSLDRDSVLNTLISKSIVMEAHLLNLPFSCLKFIKSGFVVLD